MLITQTHGQSEMYIHEGSHFPRYCTVEIGYHVVSCSKMFSLIDAIPNFLCRESLGNDIQTINIASWEGTNASKFHEKTFKLNHCRWWKFLTQSHIYREDSLADQTYRAQRARGRKRSKALSKTRLTAGQVGKGWKTLMKQHSNLNETGESSQRS